MTEAEALRAYFDAHMAMHTAIDADKFGAAYVKANQARDRLIQLEQNSCDQRARYTNVAPWDADERRAGGGLWDE